MGVGLEQGMEDKSVFLEQLFQYLAVKFIDIQDAQLAPVVFHIIYDFVGAGFPQGKFIRIRILPGYHIGKCINGKCIMLGGDGADPL